MTDTIAQPKIDNLKIDFELLFWSMPNEPDFRSKYLLLYDNVFRLYTELHGNHEIERLMNQVKALGSCACIVYGIDLSAIGI